MMAMDISENLGSFRRMASIPRAAITQAAAAARTGFTPRISPAATPAREVWDRASPIMDRRLHTITIPIQGMMAARRMPTRNARCINAYSKISMAILLPARRDRLHTAVLQKPDIVRVSRQPLPVMGDDPYGHSLLPVNPIQKLIK